MNQLINTLQDIKNLNINNEYTEKRFIEAFNLKEEIKHYVDCEMEIDLENDNNITLWLDKENGVEITRNYKNEFHVFGKRVNIAWSQIEEIKKQLAEPKGFKVLSTKKLQDWIAYTINLNKLCQEKAEDNAAKIARFLQKVDTMHKAGCELTMSESGLQGWLSNKDFQLNFTCDMQSGYTSQHIRLVGNDTIENMAELSNIKL